MLDDIKEILLSEEDIDKLTTDLAKRIDEDYADRNRRLLLLGILKGSVVFLADLMKKIKRPMEIDFMKVSSYQSGTVSTGKINIILDLHRSDLSQLDILVVEDIYCFLFFFFTM